MSLLKAIFRPRRRILGHPIETSAGVTALLAQPNAALLRFQVPARLVLMRGALAFGGWNPLVEEIRQPGTLARYYASFRPRTLAELYFLDAGELGATLSPIVIPWIENEFGTYATDPLRPNYFFGPANDAILAKEIARLGALQQSVKRRGFRPDRHGDLNGYFLRRGADFRFFLASGKHRAAVLAASQQEYLPVTLRGQGAPNVVDRSAAGNWPFVRSGLISAAFAQAVFDRYMDWDGKQQQALFSRVSVVN